jgi:uncharacterized RDD family membrane protein YckC
LQCGGVLPSSVPACHFCNSSLTTDFSSHEESSRSHARNDSISRDTGGPPIRQDFADAAAWRGELTQRLQSYRARRRKLSPNDGQSQLRFESAAIDGGSHPAVAIEEPAAAVGMRGPRAVPEEEFSFTIAIGRPPRKPMPQDARMVIDVSLPSTANPDAAQPAAMLPDSHAGLYPVASIDERRIAGLIDTACLLFAYGGFLALFGSVHGEFTFSKLSAAVCFATFALVYVQYFSLFTVFGGTTPGMMMRNLQVVNFSGEPPSPRQMLWRAFGYILSAGTFFLGFLWAMWDEDELTWHDRLSHTYLGTAETLADLEPHGAAPGR